MRRQYSKKDFTRIAQEAVLPSIVKDGMEGAYAKILRENRSENMDKRIVRPIRRVLLVALCISLVATGALAAYLSANTDFFQTVFGRQSVDALLEYDEDGKIVKNLPVMERVDVDDAQADALLGAYLEPAEGPYHFQMHSGPLAVQVLGNVFDSTTGTGIVALTLEREAGGFPELAILDTGWVHFQGGGLMLSVADGDAVYYDDAKSSENKIFLSVSYVQLGSAVPELRLFELIPVADVDPSEITDENRGEDYIEFGILTLPLQQAQALPSIALGQNGADAANISTVGMRLDLVASGFYNGADDYAVKKIEIEFAGGDTYLVMDREGRIANYEYALIPEDGSAVSFCFNRPIDIEAVKSMTINDVVLEVK